MTISKKVSNSVDAHDDGLFFFFFFFRGSSSSFFFHFLPQHDNFFYHLCISILKWNLRGKNPISKFWTFVNSSFTLSFLAEQPFPQRFDVSVVVVFWNGQSTLDSLLSKSYQIILVHTFFVVEKFEKLTIQSNKKTFTKISRWNREYTVFFSDILKKSTWISFCSQSR